MNANKSVLEIIKQKIETDYKEDVALLVAYNVNATFDDDRAGMDFYFVPKDDRSKRLSTQFIIGEVSYDLFPMSWERLIKNAALDSPQAYLLTETQVVYYSDQKAYERFMALKGQVENLMQGQYAEALLNKAYEYLNETYVYLHNMTYENRRLIDIKLEASKIAANIAYALAFANSTYYKGGQGTDISIIDESMKLKALPHKYQTNVEALIQSFDGQVVLQASRELIDSTRELLDKKRASYAQMEPFETFFTGYYEEFKSIITRFEIACQNQKQTKLFLLAGYMHEEVAQFLTKVETGIWFNDRDDYAKYSQAFEDHFKVDFFDMIAKEDYEGLLNEMKLFEEKMIKLMADNQISILKFNHVDEFSDYFNRK